MKRLEGVKALAFVALVAAISLILVLITTYTTNVGIILLFVLPLCAALVSLNTDIRYTLVYVIASLLMSFINIQLALFSVLPSLISGITFGLLIKKYIHGYYIIFINSLIQLLLQIGAVYLIKLIYNVDMINLIATVMKFDTDGFMNLYYLFLYFISLASASLSYLIITNELKKLNYEFNEKMNQFWQIIAINLIIIAFSVGFYFIYQPLSYLFIGMSFYFGILLGYYLFSFYLKKNILLIQIPLYVVSLIGIAVLFSIINKNARPLLFLLLPGSQLFGSLYIVIYQCLYKRIKISKDIFTK